MKNKNINFGLLICSGAIFVTYTSEHEKEEGGIPTTTGDKYSGGNKI